MTQIPVSGFGFRVWDLVLGIWDFREAANARRPGRAHVVSPKLLGLPLMLSTRATNTDATSHRIVILGVSSVERLDVNC
jgi:hypothetical protein